MKRIDYSSAAWEERVLALLSRHPDTIAVLDVRHLDPAVRRGADGIWRIFQEGRKHEVPFSIHVASPWEREVNFEVAELHGADRVPGAALSEVVQLFFVCSPESHSMLTVPGPALRDHLASYPGHARRVTQVARDVKGARLSERVSILLSALHALPGTTVSSPDSW